MLMDMSYWFYTSKVARSVYVHVLVASLVSLLLPSSHIRRGRSKHYTSTMRSKQKSKIEVEMMSGIRLMDVPVPVYPASWVGAQYPNCDTIP